MSPDIFLIGAEFTRAWADIIHERGPDTPDPQPGQKVREDDKTTGPDGAARKLESLKSQLEANLPPKR